MDCLWAQKGRCKEQVWVKDTYRRTGRGKSGFEMHYNAKQCGRKVNEGHEYCWQHKKSNAMLSGAASSRPLELKLGKGN